MRRLRHILIVLAILCYRGLSAQELDLYDFRTYKRFSSPEEWIEEERDSVRTIKPDFGRKGVLLFDYGLSIVGAARRGYPLYRRATTVNGIDIHLIDRSSARALQLNAVDSVNLTRYRIDTLAEERTSMGFTFSSRNMPYSINLATAQKFARGWALASYLSARTGRDLHIDGLFGNSLKFNAIATKKFKKEQLLSLGIFFNPSMRSTRSATTKEALRLMGNNLYNPAWGYQNGKVRSARIRREIMPTAFIGYEGKVGNLTRLNIAIAATAGIEKYSGLDWFDTQTPLPDNYRYMPSYFADEEDIFHETENSWITNDTRYTQIDFDRLIATNRINGGKATYAISDRVERLVATTLRGEATTSLKSGYISYGIEAKLHNSRNYKQMRDLLGAKYTMDIDYFLLDDDTFGNFLQNNLDRPNRRIAEGDRYGYDYAMRRHNISLFGTYHYSANRANIDIAAAVGYTDISRRGFYRKELFKDNSFGTSRHIQFAPYALRISADYTISNNHYIRGIIAANAQPCDAEDLFLQSQYNNRIIDNPTPCSCYDAEFEYIFLRKSLRISTTLFVSAELNNTQVRHLYDDLSSEYADIVTSNIDHLRYGLEAEVSYHFADHFRLSAAIMAGRFQFIDNARVSIYSDAANIVYANNIESHTKGLSIGGMPQVAALAGLSYYNRGWFANINFNYAGLHYIEPSATMRTERVLRMSTSAEQRAELMAQERLQDAFTIDISLSKSLYLSRLNKRIYSTAAAPRFEDKHPRSRLIFRVGVRNLLGSTDIVYRAYESSRLQRYTLAGERIYRRQDSRYLYAYPRTFYASATFAF